MKYMLIFSLTILFETFPIRFSYNSENFNKMENYIDITNSLDYIVLNENLFPYLNQDEIPVGIRNFMLLGKPCLLNIIFEGNKYKRMFTEAIPHQLASDICSVQIYKKI